jgi:Amt family ammonium transporter
VGLVVLRKLKLAAFMGYAVVYFILIWNLPAAWIWNPTGWLAKRGMVDFAGGLVVHGAAGAAGLQPESRNATPPNPGYCEVSTKAGAFH